MALEDREDSLSDHAVTFIEADSMCSEGGGSTAALRILADPAVVGVIGPTCSSAAVSASSIVSNTGSVLISGSSTAPSLTSLEGHPASDHFPGFFRTAQNDSFQGKAAAAFAFNKLKLFRAAIVHENDPYTKGLALAFAHTFRKMGGEIVLEIAVNKGDTDMSPVLDAIASAKAEFVFLPLFRPEGDLFITQANTLEALQDIVFMTSDGLYLKEFINNTGDAATGLYYVLPAPPSGSRYESFVNRYKEQFKESPTTSYHAHTYDATNLLLDSIRSVAIEQADGSLLIGKQALRDALYSTKNYAGLTGSISCDDFGDCGASRFRILRLNAPSRGLDAMSSHVIYEYPME